MDRKSLPYGNGMNVNIQRLFSSYCAGIKVIYKFNVMLAEILSVISKTNTDNTDA